MDANELWQLVTILVIAGGALFAAPAVFFLLEGSRWAAERERRAPRRRRVAPRYVQPQPQPA